MLEIFFKSLATSCVQAHGSLLKLSVLTLFCLFYSQRNLPSHNEVSFQAEIKWNWTCECSFDFYCPSVPRKERIFKWSCCKWHAIRVLSFFSFFLNITISSSSTGKNTIYWSAHRTISVLCCIRPLFYKFPSFRMVDLPL